MPRSGGMTGTFLTGEAVARSPDNAAEPLDAAFDVSSAADRLTLKPGCQLGGRCKNDPASQWHTTILSIKSPPT